MRKYNKGNIILAQELRKNITPQENKLLFKIQKIAKRKDSLLKM